MTKMFKPFSNPEITHKSCTDKYIALWAPCFSNCKSFYKKEGSGKKACLRDCNYGLLSDVKKCERFRGL